MTPISHKNTMEITITKPKCEMQIMPETRHKEKFSMSSFNSEPSNNGRVVFRFDQESGKLAPTEDNSEDETCKMRYQGQKAALRKQYSHLIATKTDAINRDFLSDKYKEISESELLKSRVSLRLNKIDGSEFYRPKTEEDINERYRTHKVEQMQKALDKIGSPLKIIGFTDREGNIQYDSEKKKLLLENREKQAKYDAWVANGKKIAQLVERNEYGILGNTKETVIDYKILRQVQGLERTIKEGEIVPRVMASVKDGVLYGRKANTKDIIKYLNGMQK